MNLKDKTIVVTGTTRGIGQALVKEFKNQGAIVYEVNRKEHDVQKYKDMLKFRHSLLGNISHIDILVNSAGLKLEQPFYQTDLKVFQKIMQTNLFGCVHTIKALLPLMGSNSHIINISSMKGLHGKALSTVYCASKFAVVGFSESLRQELKPFGINVSVVCPSATDVDVGSYEGRTITKEDVVRMVLRAIKTKHFIILPNLEKLIIHKLWGLF